MNVLKRFLTTSGFEVLEGSATMQGASNNFVRRDIKWLSLYNPIYIKADRHGEGIFVIKNV